MSTITLPAGVPSGTDFSGVILDGYRVVTASDIKSVRVAVIHARSRGTVEYGHYILECAGPEVPFEARRVEQWAVVVKCDNVIAAVDSAIAWAEDKSRPNMPIDADDDDSPDAPDTLVAEVRRLRSERASILSDFADTVGNCEVWGDNPEEMRHVIREAKRRLESHNGKINDGAKPQDNEN